MSNKILVTDTLFIFPEHIKKLKEAGYEIERLPKPDATERVNTCSQRQSRLHIGWY